MERKFVIPIQTHTPLWMMSTSCDLICGDYLSSSWAQTEAPTESNHKFKTKFKTEKALFS